MPCLVGCAVRLYQFKCGVTEKVYSLAFDQSCVPTTMKLG